jgi:hypothetical protein
MQSAKYLVAIPFSPWEIGLHVGKGLHCTLLHWFTLSKFLTEKHLKTELRLIGLDFAIQHIELVSSQRALFGPNFDVPVSVLEKNEKLDLSHRRLVAFLRTNLCGLPREDWIESCYRAHVSVNHGQVFAVGQRHRVSRLALIRQTVDSKKSVIFQMHW